ncbi:MAG: flagellar motor stator protein MotA [Deltaproteobacteria bacterium]|nr:flagellar motor stator protein MotA [Deltaproteobacteria bacterium]
MFIIIGIIFVLGSIVGGYLMEHGNLHVLMQPAELVIIGGSAAGSLFIMAPPKCLFKIFKALPAVLGGSKYSKDSYLELLSLLYEMFSNIRKEGLLAIEKDIESPDKSALFKKYPKILANHHAMDFLCDNMRVFVVGIKPMEFDEMMTLELETHHTEQATTPGLVTKVADSLPGFGIVAAVMGVVITMGKMAEPPEVIGRSVASALVGTFLGILLSYGFVGPLANNLEHKANEDSKYLAAIKTSLLAFANDMPPQMAVEFGRRVLYEDAKPSFKELEVAVKKKK